MDCHSVIATASLLEEFGGTGVLYGSSATTLHNCQHGGLNQGIAGSLHRPGQIRSHSWEGERRTGFCLAGSASREEFTAGNRPERPSAHQGTIPSGKEHGLATPFSFCFLLSPEVSPLDLGTWLLVTLA